MKSRKLRIKRKVVVKSRKKGKINRKISNRRKQRKSMMLHRTRQNKYRRDNLKKRFSRKISGGGWPKNLFTSKEKPSNQYDSFQLLVKTQSEAGAQGDTGAQERQEGQEGLEGQGDTEIKKTLLRNLDANRLPPPSDGRISTGLLARVLNRP